MEEIRKPVVGYEWLYEISDQWRVKSLERIVLRNWKYPFMQKWRIRSVNYSHTRWYASVWLQKPWWGSRTEHVHVMVAKAFIPNPDNKRTVNHKDGNKKDNSVSNLEWMTYWENNQHSYDAKLRIWRPCPFKWVLWKDNPFSKKINQYTKQWEFVKRRDAMMDIQRELWFWHNSIWACCSWYRNAKEAYGFIWKYAND